MPELSYPLRLESVDVLSFLTACLITAVSVPPLRFNLNNSIELYSLPACSHQSLPETFSLQQRYHAQRHNLQSLLSVQQ